MSVHIPKSAGTSFRWVLRSVYGERVWYNYGRIFARGQAMPGVVPVGTQCIHGHFLADAFDGLFPRKTLITWVRHPVERVAATYYHCLRTPDPNDDCCRLLHERKLSLREFAGLDWMRNTASRYLAGKPVDAFAFVGIVEAFEESARRFLAAFGGSALPVVPRQNLNPARPGGSYALPPELYAEILANNQADLTWYNEAVARHRQETALARSA